MFKGVGENGGFNLLRDPVEMRAFCPRQPVNQAVRPIGLEVAPDLIELLAGILQARETLESSEASSSRDSLRRAIFSVVAMLISVEFRVEVWKLHPNPNPGRHGHTCPGALDSRGPRTLSVGLTVR
jgi:hypothetical protein